MSAPRLNAAFYAAPVSEFLAASDEEAYAPLAAPKGYTLAPEQLSAWHVQLPVLRAALADLPAGVDAAAPAPWIRLEFDIPRLGRRVDAVLVTPSCVIPIEFKVGAKKFERLDYEQAWDYGLDLKNFHAPSHAAAIFPILCATEARDSDRRWKPPHADGVHPSHSHDITRSDAGAVNLAATSGCIERIIAAAKAGRRKAVVFVTGVPGAGKTLVGLNVATRHGERSDAAHAVFLSGNGPPQSHHFRDDTLRDPAPPDDHVVVFDEAQRAWDARQLASFMKRKKGRPGDQHGRGGDGRVARERPHGVPRLGRLHFAAPDRLRVCGHRCPRSAHGIAGRCGGRYVRAGLAPLHLDAFLPRRIALPLREGVARRRPLIRSTFG
jgi:hypothetical protein